MFYFCATFAAPTYKPSYTTGATDFPSEAQETSELHHNFSLTTQQATIRGKQGVGSNGRKGQSPFQPNDVLAGAESRNSLGRVILFYHRGSGWREGCLARCSLIWWPIA